MALEERGLCVFCGKKPNERTREHVVPYWLLEMTGNPNRVVTLGQNFEKEKEPIRFSWASFVAPACKACNNTYAALEHQVKPVVEALQRREALPVSAYVILLDWLDKVRVGVWLLRHLIEKHPVKITPNFHISSRIGLKDRMVAIYAFDSQNKGINLAGTDSQIFFDMPCCFGLRINDLLLLNVSTDFFCSKGCGLPHPTSMRHLIGGENDGMLTIDGFAYAAKVHNPITKLKLFKPVVWIYQPIRMRSSDPVFKGGYFGHSNAFDSRLFERTLDGQDRQGALFRQHPDRVEILRDPRELIKFNEVTGSDCAMQKDIVASVYDLQVSLFREVKREWIEPKKPTHFDRQYRKMKLDHTAELAEMYRTFGEHPGSSPGQNKRA